MCYIYIYIYIYIIHVFYKCPGHSALFIFNSMSFEF